MAVTRLDMDGGIIVHDTDADTTPENDVLQGPGSLRRVHVANPVAGIVYLKFWDNLAPTHGTTEPDEVYAIDASDEFSFSVHPPNGLAFATGLSFAMSDSTGPGRAAGANPSSNVTVTLECV